MRRNRPTKHENGVLASSRQASKMLELHFQDSYAAAQRWDAGQSN